MVPMLADLEISDLSTSSLDLRPSGESNLDRGGRGAALPLATDSIAAAAAASASLSAFRRAKRRRYSRSCCSDVAAKVLSSLEASPSSE